jgi:hypothetical protein
MKHKKIELGKFVPLTSFMAIAAEIERLEKALAQPRAQQLLLCSTIDDFVNSQTPLQKIQQDEGEQITAESSKKSKPSPDRTEQHPSQKLKDSLSKQKSKSKKSGQKFTPRVENSNKKLKPKTEEFGLSVGSEKLKVISYTSQCYRKSSDFFYFTSEKFTSHKFDFIESESKKMLRDIKNTKQDQKSISSNIKQLFDLEPEHFDYLEQLETMTDFGDNVDSQRDSNGKREMLDYVEEMLLKKNGHGTTTIGLHNEIVDEGPPGHRESQEDTYKTPRVDQDDFPSNSKISSKNSRSDLSSARTKPRIFNQTHEKPVFWLREVSNVTSKLSKVNKRFKVNNLTTEAESSRFPKRINTTDNFPLQKVNPKHSQLNY